MKLDSSQRPYRVLILYTELAQYLLSSISRFVERNEAQILIVRWPLNQEAPFEFEYPDRCEILDRDTLNNETLLEKAKAFGPDAILASGWVDKGYTHTCKLLKKEGVRTIMCTDTRWTGSLKQRAAAMLSPVFVQNAFSDVWVTGQPQKKYAEELGFSSDNIFTGFYSADVDRFKTIADHLQSEKAAHYPKRFLYMGRYIESKGIVELVNAFAELQNEEPNEWELWCCGAGELEPLPIEHPRIKHYGFVQPKDVRPFIEQTGVFVLPSHYEPWGVVVHEMAASGMPMLLSSSVGAAEYFLEEGRNGSVFRSGEMGDLKNGLKRFMKLSDDELLAMGKESLTLGLKYDNTRWSETLENILENRFK